VPVFGNSVPAARNEIMYCAALNAARQNVCLSHIAATMTAPSCTATAGAHPYAISTANVKHTDGNVGTFSSREPCTNGGVSASTASPANTQNAASTRRPSCSRLPTSRNAASPTTTATYAKNR
jgi:hypothetical protein